MSESSVITCEGVSKAFEIPHDEYTTLRGRLLHPFTRTQHTHFQALQDVAFQVQKGEFFGIVGRNGSGKSTLLKIMAGIYKADSGFVEIHGSVAPFIELGVGFNEDLSAKDNLFINGVILGMTRRQIKARYDDIVEFAELEGFMEMKLRNFSSGMLMRLAFAIAVQSGAEVLLIDEVLAVGDERFQQKCQDVFRERRRRGETVVLVTHDMSAIEAFCDRVMLLDRGNMVAIGTPGEVVPEYHRLNRPVDGTASSSAGANELAGARLTMVGLDETAPDAVDDQDAPMRLKVDLEVPPEVERASVRMMVLSAAGGIIGELVLGSVPLVDGRTWSDSLAIENVLAAGTYRIIGELHVQLWDGGRSLAAISEVAWVVGGEQSAGSVRFKHQSIAGRTTEV